MGFALFFFEVQNHDLFFCSLNLLILSAMVHYP